MKKKISYLLYFVFMICLVVLNINTYKVREYSSSIRANSYMNPAPNYITKIEINLTDKAKISPVYTYLELMSLFENNWSFANNSRCDRGNNNIYFYACPDGNKCLFENATRPAYADQVMGEKS